MKLPYRRPRFIEIHDQFWCPPLIRQQVQTILTFLWLHRIPYFQTSAPFLYATDILQRLVKSIEEEQGSLTPTLSSQRGKLRIVDCCSGGGGPMPRIEWLINRERALMRQSTIPVLLSDLHPHLEAWTLQAKNAISGCLSFLPYPVDATHAPLEIRKGRHIRTFCLSFHHFGEQGARRVLEDTMRTAEGIVIFEMQEPNLGSVITIIALWPLLYLITPFTRPSRGVLFLTYVIPIIPFILVLDGLISAWRTRSLAHIKHLSQLASLTLTLEGREKEGQGWKWTEERYTHTWPFGTLVAIVGRRGDETDDADEVWFEAVDEKDGESVFSEDE